MKNTENITPTNGSNGQRQLEDEIVNMAASGELAEISRRAIQEQIKKGIPVTFKRGRQVVKRFADGHEEILAELPPPQITPRSQGIPFIKNK